MKQWQWPDRELTMTRYSIESFYRTIVSLLSHHCAIAMVPSHYRPIASPCYRTMIIALSRHPVIVIAPSLHRHCKSRYRHLIVASSHYRLQHWWCDGTIVSYMVLSGFHSFEWALPILKKSYFKTESWIYFNIEIKNVNFFFRNCYHTVFYHKQLTLKHFS